MASIFQRGPSQFQATVRQKGYPRQTRTFTSKRDALGWVSVIKSEMVRGTFVDRKQADRTTLGDLIERYASEVTPKKRGSRPEQSRLKRFLAHPSALQRLSQLRCAVFSEYRDERLDEGAPDKTVREELLLYSAIFHHARLEWSIPVENFVQLVRKPSPGQHRERRLSPDEEAKLLTACKQSPNAGLVTAFILAIETGMRRGEIAGMDWLDVDFKAKVIILRRTKNGEGRSGASIAGCARSTHGLAAGPWGPCFTFYDSNGKASLLREPASRLAWRILLSRPLS